MNYRSWNNLRLYKVKKCFKFSLVYVFLFWIVSSQSSNNHYFYTFNDTLSFNLSLSFSVFLVV